MATFKEATAVRDQLVTRDDLWTAGMNSVGIMHAKEKNGYAVKVNFERGPISDLPTEIDGVPIYAEIVRRIEAL
jgi:hypothetical protein